MSIFGKIKDAIFGKAATPAPAVKPSAAPGSTTSSAPAQQRTARATVAATPAAPVDVEQVLSSIAASKGNPDLNYKRSIVDLMKLLDLDSSLSNRKELATELGYTGSTDGSAEMNIWLHKAVMRQLARNGGKVPASMTD